MDRDQSRSTKSLSASSTPRSKLTFTPDTDTSGIGELFNGVRLSVAALTQAFDKLQPTPSPNADPSAPAPTVDPASTKQQIHNLRKQLVAQDKTQEEHINKIKALIREVLIDQISDQFRKHLRELVREQVGETVRERVAAQLANQVPTGLAQEMSLHRDQMQVVKQGLHNAEARRTNALIRSTRLSDPLSPLLKEDGFPSTAFPPTLVDLFSMPAPSVHDLMDEYGIHLIEGDPRETNLNKIMQFIGVTLQMVPAPSWSTAPPLITSI